MANKPEHKEVIIIGGGPAGLAAGIYTARARLDSLLIERGMTGGQSATAERLNNYPGFPKGINGAELAMLMSEQGDNYGLKTLTSEVTGVNFNDEQKVVETTEGGFTAKAVIIASGCQRQKLNVPGEEEFTGRGVSYCATCDGAFFKEMPLAIVGGGNAAVTEALHLTKFASKVTVIHRRDQLRATAIVQEKAFAEPKIDFVWDSVVTGIEGDNAVRRIKLRNVKTEDESALDVSGIFVAIGLKPNTGYLGNALPLDKTGAIIVNGKMETGVSGVFAAGDIRQNSPRQVITAAGDGATAAIGVANFLA